MQLFYGRDGTIEQADDGWIDGDDPVVARVQPRAVAPNGTARETTFGPLWCVVRADGACTVRLTPILDGVVRDDLMATHTIDEESDGIVRDHVIRSVLSQPDPLRGFSRSGLRGVWFAVRATLEPDRFTAGTIFGLGGFELEHRGGTGVSAPTLAGAG